MSIRDPTSIPLPDSGADRRNAALASIADEFGIAEVYVFGSKAPRFRPDRGPQATGPTPAPDGDLDLGVRLCPGTKLGARRRAELVVALEDVFDEARVDLVLLSDAGAFLALAVISGELLYCRDERDHAEYELYVLRRAGDLARFERERRSLILDSP